MQRTKFNDDDDQSCILNFRIRSCATACSWTERERENGVSRGIHVNFQGMPFDLNFDRVISREWEIIRKLEISIPLISRTNILAKEEFAREEYWVNKLSSMCINHRNLHRLSIKPY